MIENWKANTDKGKSFGDLLTGLSEAFDCFPHERLITKREAYEFSKTALKLMCRYLFHRKQRVKIKALYSTQKYILSSVPQRSILRSLLFN